MKKILFIVTLFIFCIGYSCYTNITPDNDLWARLIAGGFIVENLALPKFYFLFDIEIFWRLRTYYP